MKKTLNEELNRMKHLFGIKGGELMSESKISKTYLSEQNQKEIKKDFEVYIIKPSVKNYPNIPVAVKGGKIFAVSKVGDDYTLTYEIGFSNAEDLINEKNKTLVFKRDKQTKKRKLFVQLSKANQIYNNGIKYVTEILSTKSPQKGQLIDETGKLSNQNLFNQVTNYLANRKDLQNSYGIGFALEIHAEGSMYEGKTSFIPHIFGMGISKTYRNSETLKTGLVSVQPDQPQTTTTTTIPVVPRPFQLELQNAFFYDCPNMEGCGSKGGTNESPLRNENDENKIIEFGKNINKYYKEDKPIYVLGFASVDGETQHNLELSQNRADYVANLIKSQISNPKIKIIALGKGETDVFQKGNKESDYIENRKIIITKDPNSTEPIVFNLQR